LSGNISDQLYLKRAGKSMKAEALGVNAEGDLGCEDGEGKLAGPENPARFRKARSDILSPSCIRCGPHLGEGQVSLPGDPGYVLILRLGVGDAHALSLLNGHRTVG